MSDQDSIFQESTQTPASTGEVQTQEPAPSVDAFADLLASIKSEDGRQKYTDVETALKSLPHANQHISTLEKEMAQLKDELARRKSAEEVLESMQSKTPDKTEQPSAAAVDLAQIEQLVEKKLLSQRQQQEQMKNVSSVTEVLSKTYGDKAEEVFYATAKEAGLTMEQINTLAATAPAAVLKLMGVNKGQGVPGRTHSSVNTEAMANNGQADKLSAKVPFGASTRDMVNAWRNAKPTS